MRDHMEYAIENLTEHSMEICLFLTLFILTWVGVGNVITVSLLGLILCTVGLMQHQVKADIWVLVPLIFYNLISMISSYSVYGNIVDGYASTQLIYPVIYLIMACADDKKLLLVRQLCVLWTGVIALAGIGQFVYRAVALNRPWRMSGLLGNSNATGIFLVIGWLILAGCVAEKKENRLHVLLSHMEPFLLAALALTLSMGCFLAMAAGILVLFIDRKRQSSYKDTGQYACRLLAKAGLGIGTGLLLYLAAARTDIPQVCLLLLPYVMATAVCWKKYEHFLKTYPYMAAGISAAGVLVAAAFVLLRPSSIATFAERIEMMQSGWKYLMVNPLLGVGPYQWRLLNLHDGGKYFNTWHIHNVLLHVGVEMGLIAMSMLIIVIVRFWRKNKNSSQRAGFMAYFFHNLIDTGFFYMGITALLLLTTGDPQNGGKKIPHGIVKTLFGIFALIFLYDLYRYMTA